MIKDDARISLVFKKDGYQDETREVSPYPMLIQMKPLTDEEKREKARGGRREKPPEPPPAPPPSAPPAPTPSPATAPATSAVDHQRGADADPAAARALAPR